MREIDEKAARAFTERFGEAPEAVASAPGRVNLIGEYTDFNGGFVLPCAVDRRIAAAIGRTPDGEGVLFSANFEEERLPGEDPDGTWADYPRGVAWAMSRRGAELPAFRAAFAGDVPLGSGLWSSAAIEAATALALDALFGFGTSMRDLALLCQNVRRPRTTSSACRAASWTSTPPCSPARAPPSS